MNPLTAPAVLNEGLADFLDADIPFLLVVVMFFLVFAIGHATGYTHGHLNGVDRERRRLGSRLRHPAVRRVDYARFDAEITQHPDPAMARGESVIAYLDRRDGMRAAPQLLSVGRIPAPSDEEFAEWSRRLDDALRHMRTGEWVPSMLRPDKRMVCGKPAQTNLGGVRCLAAPGHPGQC